MLDLEKTNRIFPCFLYPKQEEMRFFLSERMSPMQENKMGRKPVLPLLLSMAFPPMFSMLIQSLYNIVDSMFIARFSENALTAVSLAFPLQNLILAVSVGTGVGVNSFISRKLGERKREEADRAAAHGLVLALFSAVCFILLGILFIRPFFSLFTDSPEILGLSCDYTYIVVFFCFGQLLHINIEKTLQATGNMIYPMIMQAFGAVINIILDPILIFGLLGLPSLGVKGAAIATVIGQLSAMALSFLFLLCREHEVRPDFRHFRLSLSMIKDIYVVGLPTILMNSLGSVLVTGLNSILMGFSNLAVSVYGVYFKLQTFVFMPMSGLTQGALPIMGYNYGAGSKKRMLQTLKCSLAIGAGIMLAGTLLFSLFPGFFLSFFHASEEMLAMGGTALRIISVSYLPATVCFLCATTFQAMGKGGYSLTIFLLRQLVIPLPAAFLLAGVFGLPGVWASFVLAETATALVSVWFFLRVYRRDPVLSN